MPTPEFNEGARQTKGQIHCSEVAILQGKETQRVSETDSCILRQVPGRGSNSCGHMPSTLTKKGIRFG